MGCGAPSIKPRELNTDTIEAIDSKQLATRNVTGKEDLAAANGLALSGPRSLHQWSLLWQEKIVLGFVDQIPTDVITLDEQIGTDRSHQELWRHQRKTNMLQNLHTYTHYTYIYSVYIHIHTHIHYIHTYITYTHTYIHCINTDT